MGDPLAEVAATAEAWLEGALLPIAVAAARLPSDTPLEALLALPLDGPDEDNGATPGARVRADGLLLPGAARMGEGLARTPRAAALRRLIVGLLWRAAFELQVSGDLVADTTYDGMADPDFLDRHDAAADAWEPWLATNPAVEAAVWSLLAQLGDEAP